MFVPEYSISPKALKNISVIEYGRAVIENTVILQNWEAQLRNQAYVAEICSNLLFEGYTFDEETVKKALGSTLQNAPSEINKIKKLLEQTVQKGGHKDLNESDLRYFYSTITGTANFRQKAVPNKVQPAEILAELVELFDWINSLDALDTHPVVVAAITKIRLEQIMPFERFDHTIINLIVMAVLGTFNYSFKNYVSISAYYRKGRATYAECLGEFEVGTIDYTKWIEYFSEALAMQISAIQEKVKLLAKDTKIAKVSGRVRLSNRQEKIIEHLQDYGILQNKDFPLLFPDKSEDSVLRDLKKLLDMGLIQKVGSTKSSRYELK